jgi:hypothetical protein
MHPATDRTREETVSAPARLVARHRHSADPRLSKRSRAAVVLRCFGLSGRVEETVFAWQGHDP